MGVAWGSDQNALLRQIVREMPYASYVAYQAALTDVGIVIDGVEGVRRRLRDIGLGTREERVIYARGKQMQVPLDSTDTPLDPPSDPSLTSSPLSSPPPLEPPAGPADHDDDEEAPGEMAARVKREARDERRNRQTARENKMLRALTAERMELIDALRAEFAACPDLYVEPPRLDEDGEHAPRSLILFISDVHVGQLMEGGLGRYNLDEFAVRARRMAEKVLAIARDLRAGGPVNHVVVAFGGDMVDGRTIHPGHDHESVGMAAQLRVGPEVFARALMVPLARAFPRVTVLAVPGNHGRLGEKGQLHRVKDSLDLAFMDILKVRCAALSNVTFLPWDEWFAHFTLHGHSFLVAHGDSFKGFAGIPFYGGQRFLSRLQSMLHLPIDVLLVGHHHAAAAFPQGHSNIVMNGSFVGTGTFGAWLGLGGPPVQKLILVTDQYACATTYDLILAAREDYMAHAPVDLDAALESALESTLAPGHICQEASP